MKDSNVTTGKGPLDGVCIMDLSTTFMGPYATMILAKMGAEVIKVEAPGGDVIRGILRGRSEGMGPIYITANTGKRSIVLDLKESAARAALHRIAAGVDIFVHNMRPEPAARLGVDADAILRVNPRCVHATFRGFGTGPYENRPAYDDVIQGLSGLAAVQGRNGDPAYVVTTMVDKTVGLAGAIAILAALHRRDETGVGEALLIPMFEFMVDYVLLENQGEWLFDPPLGEPGYPRTASLNRRPYETKDGFISVLIYTDEQWKRFFDLVGKSQLMETGRFASIQTRTAHIDELYAVVAEELLARTTSEWEAVLSDLSIPAMPVRTVKELFKDPHLEQTGFFQRVEHPTEGSLIQTAMPLQFSGGLGDVRHAPRLGEHTREVLAEAGLDEEEIVRVMESATGDDGGSDSSTRPRAGSELPPV